MERNSNDINKERRDTPIQGDTIYTTTINIDLEVETTVKIQKTTITNIIHHAKDNT